MFDLITGKVEHAPHPRVGPVLISMVAHGTLVLAALVGTFWFISPPIPRDQIMMAFVAPLPPPPPPPPPAPPPPDAPKREVPVPTSGDVAPIAEPSQIEAEPPAVESEEGVIAGVPGGVVGGLMPELPPPPPPPPPPPAPRKPVRIGGQLKEPALVYRVQPEYPAIAVASKMQGVVILEAIVDEEGRVESVRSLRTPTVFDSAAIAAVRQWRYSPVLLNGKPEKFILTVVVSFNLVN